MLQITGAKILENDIPVLIVTCTTQEMLIFRDPKTREIVVGQENRVEQCTYGAVITRIPEEMDNELTGGWKIVEVGTSHEPLVYILTFIRWLDEEHVHICRLNIVLITVVSLLSFAIPLHLFTPTLSVTLLVVSCVETHP